MKEEARDLLAAVAHPVLYAWKSLLFRGTAWYRSWEILRAFDTAAWVRRLCFYGAAGLGAVALILLVSLAALRGGPRSQGPDADVGVSVCDVQFDRPLAGTEAAPERRHSGEREVAHVV